MYVVKYNHQRKTKQRRVKTMGRKRTGDTNTTPGKDKKRMRRPKAYDSLKACRGWGTFERAKKGRYRV